MNPPLSRRDWMKLMGAAGAGSLIAAGAAPVPPEAMPLPGGQLQPQVLPLTSTSGVFTPPRGRAFQKFSFDFPEPSVAFLGLTFGFLVFTRENAYGLDAGKTTVNQESDGLSLASNGLVWAGGQERRGGRVAARLRQRGEAG